MNVYSDTITCQNQTSLMSPMIGLHPIRTSSQQPEEEKGKVQSDFDDENDTDDQFLVAMLAKAERLANEMKEIATKNSTTTSSSFSSKDGGHRRRSLPRMIKVEQPSERGDDTGVSVCSSLGYSLATATVPLPISTNSKQSSVSNINNTYNVRSITPTMKMLLSTTVENCHDNYFGGGSPEQQPSTTSKKCVDDDGHYPAELLLRTIATPPKLRRKLVRPDETDTLISTTSSPQSRIPNPALLSTITTTKSLSEELENFMTDQSSASVASRDINANICSSKTCKPQPQPTQLKILQTDADYVPIVDYCVRNTTTKSIKNDSSNQQKQNNSHMVKWEKVDSPKLGDDDYVPLKDYSRCHDRTIIKKNVQDWFDDDKMDRGDVNLGKGSLLLQHRRQQNLKRRRRRRRIIRRLLLSVFVIVIIACIFLMSNNTNNITWLLKNLWTVQYPSTVSVFSPTESLSTSMVILMSPVGNSTAPHLQHPLFDDSDAEMTSLGLVINDSVTADDENAVSFAFHTSPNLNTGVLIDKAFCSLVPISEPAVQFGQSKNYDVDNVLSVSFVPATAKQDDLKIFQIFSRLLARDDGNDRRDFVEDLVNCMLQ